MTIKMHSVFRYSLLSMLTTLKQETHATHLCEKLDMRMKQRNMVMMKLGIK